MHYMEEHGGKQTPFSESEARCLAQSVTEEMSNEYIIANISKEEEIFPLTVAKIMQKKHKNRLTKVYFSQGNTSWWKKTANMDKKISLIVKDDTKVLVYNNYQLVIPGMDLQSQVVPWYHHYVKHPGHS